VKHRLFNVLAAERENQPKQVAGMRFEVAGIAPKSARISHV
jgi:septum formation topological specificity factor MinE